MWRDLSSFHVYRLEGPPWVFLLVEIFQVKSVASRSVRPDGAFDDLLSVPNRDGLDNIILRTPGRRGVEAQC
jgi:hypothetical protein